MRIIVLSFVIVCAVFFLTSCTRGITPEQAANGKAKCGRNYIR